MPANAARALLDLIDTWKSTSNSGQKQALVLQRGGGNGNRAALWRNQLEAARHLLEIEEFVGRQPDGHEHAAMLSELRSFVFAPEQRWSQEGVALNPVVRSAVSGLDWAMQRQTAQDLHVTPAELDGMREAVEECLHILDDDTIQRDPGMRYLREVLLRLRSAFEGGDVDLERIRDDAYAAIGIATAHHSVLTEETRSRLFGGLVKLLPFASGSAQGATGNLLAETIMAVISPS